MLPKFPNSSMCTVNNTHYNFSNTGLYLPDNDFFLWLRYTGRQREIAMLSLDI